MDPLMTIIIGTLLVLVAAVVQAFCEFGRLARPDMKPALLRSWFRWVFEVLWALMLLAGGGLLLLGEGGWLMAAIAVAGFWLVLPFLLTPIIRNRLLPHWDEVKSELASRKFNDKEPYSEKNYWRGDWWMVESKQKKKRPKAPQL